MAEKIFKVGLVGAGRGGLEILELLLRSPVAKLEYVCDRNLAAPALVLARKKNIKTHADPETAFASVEVDFIFDVTGDDKVWELVKQKAAGSRTLPVHGRAFSFLLDVFENFKDEDEEDDTQKNRFLTFRVGKEDYGIDIAFITEIINAQKITAVPDMPGFVKGVINLRGNVIPVIDVRARFHIEKKEYDDRTCVIVSNIASRNVGFVVDHVNEVVDIPVERISSPPLADRGGASKFVRGMARVGDEVKILLDVEKLLQQREMDELESIQKNQ